MIFNEQEAFPCQEPPLEKASQNRLIQENNNAISTRRQRVNRGFCRWIKAGIGILFYRKLLTERFADWIVGGLRHD